MLVNYLASRHGFTLALFGLFLAIAPVVVQLTSAVRTLEADRQKLAAFSRIDVSGLTGDLQRFHWARNDGQIYDDALMAEALRKRASALNDEIARLFSDNGNAPESAKITALPIQRLNSATSRLLSAIESIPYRTTSNSHDGLAVQDAIKNTFEALAAFQWQIDQIEGNLVQNGIRTVYSVAVSFILLTIATAVAGVVALILLRREVRAREDRARVERREEHLAYTDLMTGVPNALRFQDKLAGVIATGAPATAIVADLDDFETVNDRRGRAYGDAVIKELAHRLQVAAMEKNGFAARIGGDRFGLCIPSDDSELINDFCAELLALCSKPVATGGQDIVPAISLGVVILTNLDVNNEDGYVAFSMAANLALLSAKDSFSSSFAVYNASLEKKIIDPVSLAHALPDALAKGHIRVLLQPKVILESGEIFGFAAVPGWNWNGIPVSAKDIMSAADRAAMAVSFGHYFLEQAIETIADWNRRRRTSFSVSVSLPARHFHRDGGVEFIADCLEKYPLSPDLVTIEVEDSADGGKLTSRSESIAKVKALGCKISIVDFGSGRSSLAHLRNIKADEIKIERSLVEGLASNPTARSILYTVLGLADSLNMDVIVVGLESRAQVKELIRSGCAFGQGDILGKPRPAEDWLADVTYGKSERTSAA